MDALKIKYKFDKNYNPKYSNGVIGGINPLGEIIMNFYLERRPLPNSTTISVKEGLPTSDVINVEPDDFGNTMIRFVDNGTILNYSTAKEIHRWLGEQLKVLENSTK